MVWTFALHLGKSLSKVGQGVKTVSTRSIIFKNKEKVLEVGQKFDPIIKYSIGLQACSSGPNIHLTDLSHEKVKAKVKTI